MRTWPRSCHTSHHTTPHDQCPPSLIPPAINGIQHHITPTRSVSSQPAPAIMTLSNTRMIRLTHVQVEHPGVTTVRPAEPVGEASEDEAQERNHHADELHAPAHAAGILQRQQLIQAEVGRQQVILHDRPGAKHAPELEPIGSREQGEATAGPPLSGACPGGGPHLSSRKTGKHATKSCTMAIMTARSTRTERVTGQSKREW
jgi:hypothetical protein